MQIGSSELEISRDVAEVQKDGLEWVGNKQGCVGSACRSVRVG